MVIELERLLHPNEFVTTQEYVVGTVIVFVMEGVIPDGDHANVYPFSATAARVTVAGNVQTPPGPEIIASGSGLIVMRDVIVFVQPKALVTLNVVLYVPGSE
jgi:hypothetical protein